MRLRILLCASTLALLAAIRLTPTLAQPAPERHEAVPVTIYGPTRADHDRELTRALQAVNDAIWYQWITDHPPKPKTSLRVSRNTTYGSGACGGDLPPCSVMMCESGGSLTAHNPSGADGKWQIMPRTWNNYDGYANPSDAPEDVQDARAREIYADGAGRRAWVC